MSMRDFESVIEKMLIHIPDDDVLKPSLHKILDKYSYMAPEVANRIWADTHAVILKRFDKTSPLDLPDWVLTIMKIWSDK